MARKLVTRVCGRLRIKPDRVGEQNLAPAGQFNGAQLGIEGSEHARGGKHLRAGDRIEEGAFAGVGIAHQCDRRHGNGFTPLALLLAHAAHSIELAFQVIDASLDAPAVGFKLGFAGPACADAATKLGHGFAAPCKARQHVFELGEFDLELALAGSCMAGKDVEDKLRTVEHAAGQCGLKVAKLSRRQIVIEEHQVSLNRSRYAGNLLHLAGADQGGRIGPRAPLQQLGRNLTARAPNQVAEFGERFFGVQTGRTQ